MLKKLLKYDLKWMYKVIVIFYVLALIFSCITRLCSLVTNSALFSVLKSISSGITIAMMINILINCITRSWVRFTKNMYKDESYLTHTLPVSKNKLYASKVLSTIICVLTSMLVIITCLFISYYSKENINILKNMLELAAGTYNTTVIKLLLVLFFVLLLEIIFIILVGYVGIIIGHKSNQNKMAKSVVMGIVLYILTQMVTLLLIFIFGLFNSSVMNIINTKDIINIDAIKLVLFLGIFIYVLYIAIYYVVGKKLLEKGVNVD